MAIASYAVYLKTGRFWVPSFSHVVSKLSWPDFKAVKSFGDYFGDNEKPVAVQPVTIPLAKPSEPTYKWRLNGQWHYGDTPPEGVNAIRLVGADN